MLNANIDCLCLNYLFCSIIKKASRWANWSRKLHMTVSLSAERHTAWNQHTDWSLMQWPFLWGLHRWAEGFTTKQKRDWIIKGVVTPLLLRLTWPPEWFYLQKPQWDLPQKPRKQGSWGLNSLPVHRITCEVCLKHAPITEQDLMLLFSMWMHSSQCEL